MELLILIFLIILNGLFAMSEMAVVSSRKARLQQWADENRPGAQVALALANEPAAFLSTIQVGITVIGITSGAFGEATFAAGFARWLSGWAPIAPYADTVAIIIVVACITLAALIIGELIPKRLALVNPEGIASAVARPMRMLATIAHPVVRFLTSITEGVLRLFGIGGATHPPVTEEEIKVLMEQGTEAGVFEAHEQALVSRVFRLDQLKVTGIMTPRSEIEYLDLDESPGVNIERIVASGHTRYPVVRGGLEHVEGIVQTKILFNDAVAGRKVDIAGRMTKPVFVPDSLTVMQLVEAFRKHRATIALVVNEYGETQGVVTLNDVMEAMVGDIATVEDVKDLDVVRRADGSWLIDGAVTIERFKDVLDISESLPGETEADYNTVGGFVMMQLGRIPQVTDHFDWSGIRFEVMDMDRHRVDKLLVVPPKPAAQPGAQDPVVGD